MDIKKKLSDSWEILMRNPLEFIVGGIVLAAISSISSGLLTGNVYAGFFHMAFKSKRGEKVEFGDVFEGFKNFVPFFLVGLIIILGSLLCGIGVLVTMFLFTFALAMLLQDTSLEWSQALGKSKDLVMQHFGDVLIAFLITFLLNIIGSLLCIVGLFLSIPLSMIFLALVYLDISGGGTVLDVEAPVKEAV